MIFRNQSTSHGIISASIVLSGWGADLGLIGGDLSRFWLREDRPRRALIGRLPSSGRVLFFSSLAQPSPSPSGPQRRLADQRPSHHFISLPVSHSLALQSRSPVSSLAASSLLYALFFPPSPPLCLSLSSLITFFIPYLLPYPPVNLSDQLWDALIPPMTHLSLFALN